MRKKMQSLCVDTCAIQDSNGAQHTQKRMDSPRALRLMLWTFGNRSWTELFDVQLLRSILDPLRINTWWEEIAAKVTKEEKRRFNGIVIHTLWNLRKERNRKIFNNV